MKITVNELEKLVAERTAQRKALEERVVELLNREEEYKAQMQTAVDSGDAEAYKTVKAKLSELEDEIMIAKLQLDKISSEDAVTEEEAAEAWEDYRNGYEMQFSSLMEKYEKQKAELLNSYSALVDLQTEACKTREKVAEYRKLSDRGATAYDLPLDRQFPMQYLPVTFNGTSITAGDALFYLDSISKDEKRDDMEKIKNILCRHSTRPY